MKSADVVVIGAGVIGLSLACDLRRAGASVIVLERHHPGQEASWAAGGMIAPEEAGPHPAFRTLARKSAELYPGFVHVLQDESGVSVDFRTQGKIRFLDTGVELPTDVTPLAEDELRALEPEVEYFGTAVLVSEASVDPRALMSALLNSALHLGVEVDSGAEVQKVEVHAGSENHVITAKSRYAGKAIVNCAGAWAGKIGPVPIPIKPIRGQMLSVITERRLLSHVIEGNGVYLIPRSDGRLVIGSTLEDVGFDKRVDPSTVQKLHQDAAVLVPNVGQGRIHESWAGLRPCSPDKLPLLGQTPHEGYFVATGHYRDGIMLAPVTARVMTQIIQGATPELELSAFSPSRFQA